MPRSPEIIVDPSKKRVRERQFGADFFASRLGELDLDEMCGAIGFNQKIFGGELTELDEYPWTTLLIYGPESNNSFEKNI